MKCCICCYRENEWTDRYWAVEVTADVVPGHSAVDHLSDLTVNLTPIDGQIFESLKKLKAAATKCLKTTVTTSSGMKFSAPKINLKYRVDSGFLPSADAAMSQFVKA